MAHPRLLYSTNTWLAYTIAQVYYQEEHYVWCSRHMNSLWLPPGLNPLPPSSSPGDIYLELYADIRAKDGHSARISQNRIGLRKSADIKKAAGVISERQAAEIKTVADAADFWDFRPLLYVILAEEAAASLKPVPIGDRASPYHEEFIVERLPRGQFDVMEMRL